MAAGYTQKLEQLFDLATQLGFTEDDFAALACAAADQSGASAAESDKIADILGVDWADVIGKPQQAEPRAHDEMLAHAQERVAPFNRSAP